jgi:hypothetical protein
LEGVGVWLNGILLMDYLPKSQTINTEYYSSLLVQLKDILKEKRRGKFTKVFLFLPDIAPAHRALATHKKWASNVLITHPILGSDPVGLPPVLWTEKTIEKSPLFVRRRGQCCRGNLVGRIIF